MYYLNVLDVYKYFRCKNSWSLIFVIFRVVEAWQTSCELAWASLVLTLTKPAAGQSSEQPAGVKLSHPRQIWRCPPSPFPQAWTDFPSLYPSLQTCSGGIQTHSWPSLLLVRWRLKSNLVYQVIISCWSFSKSQIEKKLISLQDLTTIKPKSTPIPWITILWMVKSCNKYYW